jgi:hypothetical protein
MPVEKMTQQLVNLAYCEPGRSKVVYFCTTVTDFTFEKRQSGNTTFWLRYRDGYGKQRQYRIGNAADLSVEKAARRHNGFVARLHLVMTLRRADLQRGQSSPSRSWGLSTSTTYAAGSVAMTSMSGMSAFT